MLHDPRDQSRPPGDAQPFHRESLALTRREWSRSLSAMRGSVPCQNIEGFSPQANAEAVQWVIETGKPIAGVARDLGLHGGTVGNW